MTPTQDQIDETVKNLTLPQLHAKTIEAAELGVVTILDLFDTWPWFKTGADWTAWRSFLCALYGLEMTERERAIYEACTGRPVAPKTCSSEAWVAVGRRGRKSAVAALIGIWSAAYRMDYARSGLLAPGETARVLILSKNKDDAKQIHSYASAMLSQPSASHLVDGKPLGESIPLKVPTLSGSYKVELVIRAATIMAGRTKTVLAALLDEVAFFRSDESANPDRDIIAGIKPAMSTVPGALLLGLSSPYARRGVLWEAYEEHWGKDGSVLFWKAPTLRMHDTPQIRAHVDLETEKDPVAASAEYGAEFRADVEAYISIEAVRAATVPGRFELQPVPGIAYVAFVDPSGGSGDPMTAAVAHWEDGRFREAQGPSLPPRAVLDAIWEVEPPFEPSEEIERLSLKLKAYGIRQVEGDHWGGEFPAMLFKQHDLIYYVSERTKASIYQEALPWINSGSAELLDIKRLRAQLVGLDRRTSRGGKDSIDHAPGQHDDVANAACGALLRAVSGRRPIADYVPPAETTDELLRRRIAAMVKPKRKVQTNPYAKRWS